MNTAPKDVDAYIAAAPRGVRGKLRELRRTIREAAPDAAESISYGMPYYGYKGRVVYFRHWKNHISLYALTGPVLEANKTQLRGHITGKGTISFGLDETLPLSLIKRMVKAQAKRNEAKR